MLPLSLLKAAESRPMLIELKNGDTYNGRLVNCNMFMNICLRDVICTSRDGDKFWKLPECYIRGNAIKYLRLPEEIIDLVPQDSHHAEKKSSAGSSRGGSRGGRGGGRLGRGRGEESRDGRGRGSSGRGSDRGRGSYRGRGH